MESILNSIKKMLGPSADDEHFDPDIIMHINSVFMVLKQLGVGPSRGFFIEDASTTWNQYIDDPIKHNAVKTYMYAKVKLVFDPPQNASHIKVLEQTVSEFEWRLNHGVEVGDLQSGNGDSDYNPVAPGEYTNDYEKLQNLPRFNGKILKGDVNEEDPTIAAISEADIKAMWEELDEES